MLCANAVKGTWSIDENEKCLTLVRGSLFSSHIQPAHRSPDILNSHIKKSHKKDYISGYEALDK